MKLTLNAENRKPLVDLISRFTGVHVLHALCHDVSPRRA